MRLLHIDIETSPMESYHWGLWQQNIGLNQIKVPTRMLSFSAKWHGEDTVFYASKNKASHKKMVRAAYNLLDEADVVVHYYGERFDVPHLNREFQEQKLGPTSSFHQIDLKKVAKQFYLPSYKLDYVSQWLGFEGKTPHQGFKLWLGCMANKSEAWEKMEEYNRQDVELLEDVYTELLPWIKGVPNPALYYDSYEGLGTCLCGSENLVKRGFNFTRIGKYQAYKCRDCGKYSQSGRATARVDLR